MISTLPSLNTAPWLEERLQNNVLNKHLKTQNGQMAAQTHIDRQWRTQNCIPESTNQLTLQCSLGIKQTWNTAVFSPAPQVLKCKVAGSHLLTLFRKSLRQIMKGKKNTTYYCLHFYIIFQNPSGFQCFSRKQFWSWITERRLRKIFLIESSLVRVP